ncbi:MAG: TonB-dependent receptor [Bryobacteraceae bacterium]|nr:TonB-dependent receptor [Bryobacteraceae bacterium]
MLRNRQVWSGIASVFLAAAFFITGTLHAQETTGAIIGSVTDPTGAAIPNAKVEAQSPALVGRLSTTTDASGNYILPQLPAGLYAVSVTATGFASVKKNDTPVALGKRTRLDFKMEVGSVSESVVVSADAIIVDTTSSASTTSVDKSFFDVLPRGRNFDSLIAIAPGARPEPKGGGYQIDGASGSENVFFLDGMDVTNIQNGTLNRQNQIPFEFVKEVQIKSGGLEAQYGGAIGGVVNAVWRSGSNDWHGQASYFLESNSLNAAPNSTLRLNPTSRNPEYFRDGKDDYSLINPAFQVGGPILKDRLWIFAGFMPEWRKRERTVTFLTGQTGTYEQTERQDFTGGKMDYALSQKIRLSGTYMYNPNRLKGLLPTYQGNDAYSNPWADRGSRSPSVNYTWRADILATSRLLASVYGGYNYRNFKDYGIPRGAFFLYQTATATARDDAGNLISVPSNVAGAAGNFTPNNRQTVLDEFTRYNANADVSYTIGTHSLKGGWQMNRLSNRANAGTWPDGYFRIGWGQSRTSAVGANLPVRRGQYGYYIDRKFATAGDVASFNHALFIQDTWKVNRRLTLNLGLRTEKEHVPSFRTDSGIPSKAIKFSFADKFAPRIGGAYDLTGKGRTKIYGSFGLFYDLMKYEMPRGSFGGDKWVDYVYTLDDPDILKIKVGNTPGRLIETVDWRIPSNSPDNNTIDPKLKPMRSRLFDFGFEHSVTADMIASVRYSHRTLDRTIEDVGTLTPQGEVYYIANPGFGLVADPATWEPGVPPSVKAVRDYDAVEFRLDKRYSRRLQFAVSYTWSRLYGNYGGLASSDENGRTSPNVNRYFDLPFMNYDQSGKEVYGRLATDRPHTFKAFAGYSIDSKLGTTTFSPYWAAFSGTPITSEVAVFGVPIFAYGRNDAGRTPFFSNVDLNIYHDFPVKWKEGHRVRVELATFNLFNSGTAINQNVGLIHPDDGNIEFEHHADFFKGFDSRKLMNEQHLRVSPYYLWDSGWQTPRRLRFQFTYFF